MPLLEAFPDETQMMKYKLVSLARGTATMPILQLGQTSLNIANGAPFNITPNTINYLDGQMANRTIRISIYNIRY